VELGFVKMHGLGNDFVVIQDLDAELDLEPDAVAWLCDRHFGIGADGVILVRPATTDAADLLMLYFNADGSSSAMCGNGIRCFAKYAVDRGLVSGDTVLVETLAGVRPVEVALDEDGRMEAATVDMGEPELEPAAIPTTLAPVRPDDGSVIGAELATELGTFKVTCVSMGNPHAVVWVDDVDEAPVETAGPVIETHPAFPQRTNVEFAEMAEDGVIRLRVWERGVGETLACGSGACAAVAIGRRRGQLDAVVQVHLPGGELRIEWAGPEEHIWLTGPAAVSFQGQVDL
jgi:diaminopimelate epimerase